jgi:hypothetical protein
MTAGQGDGRTAIRPLRNRERPIVLIRDVNGAHAMNGPPEGMLMSPATTLSVLTPPFVDGRIKVRANIWATIEPPIPLIQGYGVPAGLAHVLVSVSAGSPDGGRRFPSGLGPDATPTSGRMPQGQGDPPLRKPFEMNGFDRSIRIIHFRSYLPANPTEESWNG